MANDLRLFTFVLVLYIATLKIESIMEYNDKDYQEIFVAEGSNITFTCKYDVIELSKLKFMGGSSVLTKLYHYDGYNYYVSSDYGNRLEVIGNLFKINDAIVGDSGMYYCLHSINHNEKEKFKQILVDVIRKPNDIFVNPQRVEIKQTESVNISCYAKGLSQFNITWERSEGTMTERTTFAEEDFIHHGHYFKRKYLIIKNITEVEKGNYFCKASNIRGAIYGYTSLKVKYIPRIVGEDKMYLKMGSDARIICQAKGYPDFTFTWEFVYYSQKVQLNDLKKGIGRFEMTETQYDFQEEKGISVLFVKSTIQEDFQNYTCIASNEFGTSKKDVQMRMFSFRRPTIIEFKIRSASVSQNLADNRKRDRSVIVSQDATDDAKIICNADGFPPPQIKWKFNNRYIYPTTKLDNISQCSFSDTDVFYWNGRNTLFICHLNYKLHAGKYECEAQNYIDKATFSMEMIIQAKPRIITLSIATTTTKETEIQCFVNANPPANINLYELSKTDNKWIKVVPSSKALGYVFASILKTDSGTYECRASNFIGNVKEAITVKGPPESKILIAVLISAIIIIIGILSFVYLRFLKKKNPKHVSTKSNFSINRKRSLFERSSDLPYDMVWEYPRDRLTFIKILGSGCFGQVFLAEAEGICILNPRDRSIKGNKRRETFLKSGRFQTITVRYNKKNTETIEIEKTIVAVKTLKDNATEAEYKDLACELKMLIHLGEHKNVVNLLGACTLGKRLCIILEYCQHGNLLNFLRVKRKLFQPVWAKDTADMENEFTYFDLIFIALQVSNGMEFLQNKKCVHRDLAARNVLVGENYNIRIADFALARDIHKEGVYLKKSKCLLPVKWTALEIIFYDTYTSYSDVWSFGILLWEIFSLGRSPYPGLQAEELIQFLEDGKRMKAPQFCPENVYEIMIQCWTKLPECRPSFSTIAQQFSDIFRCGNLQQGYQDMIADYLSPTSMSGSPHAEISGDSLQITHQTHSDEGACCPPDRPIQA